MKTNYPFSADTRMADLVHMDYRLIPLLGRFKIEFGFGNKSVEEVCQMYSVDHRFFLEIVNSYHNPDYFPHKQLQRFKSKIIIDYLRNTHTYYLNSKVPEIQACIDEMKGSVPRGQQKSIIHLNRFFREYTEELIEHLSKEDHSVFPYVLALQDALDSREVPDELYGTILEKPIQVYGKSHGNLETKLGDLKNLIIKYLPPISNSDCRKLLIELFRLESDLENHARIEEKVLIPKVTLIEQEVLQLYGTP